MKQSIRKRVPCFRYDGDDMAVAEILVELPELIRHYSNPSFGWGVKRRRSAISQRRQNLSLKSDKVVVVATSPATPLMFSPSESDDKANTPSPVSLSKRKLQNKDELMQSVTELTHQKDSLLKEMEAMKRHLDVLRASNLELKRNKQAIIYGFSPPLFHSFGQQHQQQIQYPFQLQHRPSVQCSTPLRSVTPAVDKMAPVGLPDLNLTCDEVDDAAVCNVEGGGYQAPSDVMMVMDHIHNANYSRAIASAQARKRRMQIYKDKNQNQILRQR